MCRDYPNRCPQIRAFFDKAFLRVTLQMRANKSFHEASGEVMSWPKQDELNRPAPFDPSETKKGKGELGFKGDSKGSKGKAFDKGFEGGKGKTFQQRHWQSQPYRPSTPSAQSRPQCRLFAQGFCKFGSSCKFAHGQQSALHSHVPHSDASGRRATDLVTPAHITLSSLIPYNPCNPAPSRCADPNPSLLPHPVRLLRLPRPALLQERSPPNMKPGSRTAPQSLLHPVLHQAVADSTPVRALASPHCRLSAGRANYSSAVLPSGRAPTLPRAVLPCRAHLTNIIAALPR